jgi:hypothetical protein
MKTLARVLLGLLLGMVLAEGVTRIYLEVLGAPSDASYVSDPGAGYKLRPQSASEDTTDYHVNSLGYRDREHPAQAAPGVRRVVGIGDSFVFGEVRLRDNFLRVAEGTLNERADSSGGRVPGRERVEMFLMGLGGYSPENYVGVLRATGLPVRPDLVLLCFFIGNDVTGIPTRSRVMHGELYAVGSANRWLNLLRKSRLFVYAERYAFFRLRAARLRAARTPGAGAEGAPAAGLIARFHDLVERNRLPVFLRLPSEKMEALWREAESCLADFDRTCRAAGVPWALVIIPDEIQVSAAERARLYRRLGLDEGEYDFSEPQRRLLDFASRHSVPVLNLLPFLQGADTERAPTYEADETHWNVKGNRIAGEAVASFLRERLDSPRRPGGRSASRVPGKSLAD